MILVEEDGLTTDTDTSVRWDVSNRKNVEEKYLCVATSVTQKGRPQATLVRAVPIPRDRRFGRIN